MTASRFYMTTAIDYANGEPHIGHALEKIGADVIARYQRSAGRDVHFLMGMDEHGQKVVQSASAAGVTPAQMVDTLAVVWEGMWRGLSISYDQFIRTSSEHHKRGVQALLQRIFEKSPDDFFEQSYTGLYCVGCETFKQPSEVSGGKCVVHPTRELESVEERNWFFRLSKYTDFLLDLYERNRDFIQPESRRNEIISLVRGGLEDISASRARLSWAVQFPRPLTGGETQGTYVWFDALPNYLTATGFPQSGYEERWPADLHIIGKDITRFHCVIWPAMLKAAELPLPRRVWAHGFVLMGGDRFSKSAGVRIELRDAVALHGSDAFRYFLMREIPYDGDGTFSRERFDERYNADLANALGNLASRTIAMVGKYRDGVVPDAPPGSLDEADRPDLDEYHASMSGERGYLLHEGLRHIWRTIARGNEFVDRQAPWKLAKDPAAAGELDMTLSALVRQLARHAVHLAPFMPGKMQELWTQLGGPGAVHDVPFSEVGSLSVSGWRVTKGHALFPKAESQV